MSAGCCSEPSRKTEQSLCGLLSSWKPVVIWCETLRGVGQSVSAGKKAKKASRVGKMCLILLQHQEVQVLNVLQEHFKSETQVCFTHTHRTMLAWPGLAWPSSFPANPQFCERVQISQEADERTTFQE